MQISELLAHETLRLLLLTGEPVGVITGVVVTDLPKPGRYLNGGELVLTGMMWRHGPADSAVFVDYLVRAGVTALAAGDARLGHVPDDLVAACRERGLALLEVPIEVSFGAIIDVVDRVLLGEQRLALGRHRRIFTAVAEGAGLPELFAMARDELGVTGGVVSATGRVIAGEVPDASRMAAEFLRAVRLPHVTADPCTIFTVDRSHRVAGWALVLDGDVNPEIGYELASCVALERTRVEEGRRVERRLAGAAHRPGRERRSAGAVGPHADVRPRRRRALRDRRRHRAALGRLRRPRRRHPGRPGPGGDARPLGRRGRRRRRRAGARAAAGAGRRPGRAAEGAPAPRWPPPASACPSASAPR